LLSQVGKRSLLCRSYVLELEEAEPRDPGHYYEEGYWEAIGRQEEIAAAIKNLSEEPIREFLGTYGDAIDTRLPPAPQKISRTRIDIIRYAQKRRR
jgi:hypothetical protein